MSDVHPLYADIEAQRPYLIRFASARLRDSHQADEVVQETMLAALTAIPSFTGQSTLRTWLTAILRHKIIDLQRKIIAERDIESLRPSESSDEEDFRHDAAWFDEQFDHTGHWRQRFSSWSAPESTLQQKQFFRIFESCLDKLPKSTARLFFLREIDGMSTEEICKVENITPSNCWVKLHRARLSLRECLERHWFRSQQ